MSEAIDLDAALAEARNREASQITEPPPGQPEIVDAPVPGGKIQVVTPIATIYHGRGDQYANIELTELNTWGYSPAGIYASPSDNEAYFIPWDKVDAVKFDYKKSQELVEALDDGKSSSD